MSPLDPQQAFEDAGVRAAARLGYSDWVGTAQEALRAALCDGDEVRARTIWAAALPHDPDSLAVIMADAREARAAAERRAAL